MSHHSLARFANFSISRGSTLLDDIVAPVPLFASDARSLLAHHIPALRDAIAIPQPRASIVLAGLISLDPALLHAIFDMRR